MTNSISGCERRQTRLPTWTIRFFSVLVQGRLISRDASSEWSLSCADAARRGNLLPLKCVCVFFLFYWYYFLSVDRVQLRACAPQMAAHSDPPVKAAQQQQTSSAAESATFSLRPKEVLLAAASAVAAAAAAAGAKRWAPHSISE